MSFETIIILNLFLYLIGFVLMLSLNNSVLGEISGWTSIFINILGFIISLNFRINYYEVSNIVYPWIEMGKTKINFELIINAQSTFMFVLVQGISMLVQIFSIKYLKNDTGLPRYYAFLNLFVFSMLGLVLSGNLFELYFFWELVGFCSFLLISYWYERQAAMEASLKAFLINRIGDAFFLAGILTLYASTKTLSFLHLETFHKFSQISGIALDAYHIQTLSILLIFVGIMTKSAQFPFQIWLADAMEGPTPASALIHAATMVVAGIFLLGRLAPIITPDAGFVIAIIGAVTSIMGGFSAIFQYDIKKVLAYSTVSQLGLMIAGMGIGAVGPSLFHLTTHAFFKAGLFLCAGAVIYHNHHNQDMRKMGDLKNQLPIIYFSYVICGFSLLGLPLTSGFLSKESILSASLNYSIENGVYTYKLIIPILLAISSFLTTFYIVRQAVLVFYERDESPIEKMVDDIRMNIASLINGITGIVTTNNENKEEEPLFIRFFRSITVFEFSTLLLALGSTWLFFTNSPLSSEENWFIQNFKNIDSIHFDWLLFGPLSISLIAFVISFNYSRNEIYRFSENRPLIGFQNKLYKLGNRNFYLEKILINPAVRFFIGKKNISMDLLFSEEIHAKYEGGLVHYVRWIENHIFDKSIKIIIRLLLDLARGFRYIEIQIIDRAIKGIVGNINFAGSKTRKLQGGNLQSYVVSMLVFILTIIILKLII